METGMGIDDDGENKGSMWDLDQKIDQPMDEEAGRLRNMYREKKFSALLLARLAFQSLGVVYGDLGTSPLYVFYNTFPRGIKDPEEVIGALSLIIYSLTLIPLLKYVFIVCKANDSGQGGTFALYSLLCRHAKIGTIPNQHRTDEELTTYSRSTFNEHSYAAKTKRWLEKYTSRKNALLILVLVGTCMVIGDGILTPAISVLSASGGIKVDHPAMSNDLVVLVAVVILVGLFSMQHYGTDKVGWLFAPIVLLWLLCIGAIGMYNIWKHDSSVLKAFSPVYVYRYFKSGGKDGWTSLGGIMLSITGTEALFADLSHFPVPAIQLAFTTVVFPCLLLAYSGQAAYLMKHHQDVSEAFYKSIPETIYWPMVVVATLAAIVASQATISATFSIIKQALALGCFPRVKVVHTSKKFLGQIYIPDINWILLILCIAVTAGFRNQSQIGNAYGTAVVIVMLVTTLLMILIMLLVWHCHWVFVVLFIVLSLLVECTYFSAVLFKVDQGGWVPLVIAAAFLVIMYVWHYGTLKRYEFEMHSKVSMAWILGLGPSLGLVRVPGIGLVYTELANGVPHIFSHFITNLPAIHSVVVFVCVKYLPVYTVPEEERFLVKRIGPKNFHMFRCVARYGYKDLHKKDDDFEKKLFENLFMFVRLESMMEGCSDSDDEYSLCDSTTRDETTLLFGPSMESATGTGTVSSADTIMRMKSPVKVSWSGEGSNKEEEGVEEMEFLRGCRDAGVVHILGNTVVKARRESRIYKRIAVDYIYAFLRKICRENSVIFNIPHENLLNVGQIAVERVGGKSAVTRCFSKYPLRFIVPRKVGDSRADAVWIYSLSYGGGIVSGDSISCSFSIGDDCNAVLTTQASTKVFKSIGSRCCEQSLEAKIGCNALLVIVPDPVTCFATARYYQKQVFRIASNSSLVLVDWITSGRLENGEKWAFEMYKSTNQVFAENGQPLFIDSVLLEKGRSSIDERMQGYQVLAMVLIMGPKLKHIQNQIQEEVKRIMSNELLHSTRKTDHFGSKPEFLTSCSAFGPKGCGVVVRIASTTTESVYKFLRHQFANLEPLLGAIPYRI